MKFDDKIPIYLQIKNYLNHAIITGKYPAGSKIPSVRQLAVELTANVNTIQRSLSEMIDEGVLIPQRGKGNFVTENPEIVAALKQQLLQQYSADYYQQVHALGLTNAEILATLKAYMEDGGQQNAATNDN